MIRLVIADDQALVRAGFRMILATQPDMAVLAEARTGTEAIAAWRQHQPDVMLMDIRMPELDGLEATRRILAGAGEPCRVVILTTFDLDELDGVQIAIAARLGRLLLGLTLALAWLIPAALPQSKARPRGWRARLTARGQPSLLTLGLALFDQLDALPLGCLPQAL